MTDAAGRTVLWSWLQERRGGVGTYDYAGCMGVPRALYLADGGRLVQVPLPEVDTLRVGGPWSAAGLVLAPETATPVEGVVGPRLDIVLTLERCEQELGGPGLGVE